MTALLLMGSNTNLMKRKTILIYSGPAEGFSEKDSLSYWASRSPTERLNAVWELVLDAWRMKGKDIHELRLQRTTAVLKRI